VYTQYDLDGNLLPYAAHPTPEQREEEAVSDEEMPYEELPCEDLPHEESVSEGEVESDEELPCVPGVTEMVMEAAVSTGPGDGSLARVSSPPPSAGGQVANVPGDEEMPCEAGVPEVPFVLATAAQMSTADVDEWASAAAKRALEEIPCEAPGLAEMELPNVGVEDGAAVPAASEPAPAEAQPGDEEMPCADPASSGGDDSSSSSSDDSSSASEGDGTLASSAAPRAAGDAASGDVEEPEPGPEE
jgi:hypothetical protein